MKNIIFVLGTRPEVIKLAPVILETMKHNEKYNIIICNTEQQKELSNQALEYFNLKSNINLDIMSANQKILDVHTKMMSSLTHVYSSHAIDATFVQGDTMTVLCGALASFLNKKTLFHIEAGLRSYDLNEPFPEESIRQIVSRLADLHFAPTDDAKKALLLENIDSKKIIVTGNTGIDALKCLSKETIEVANLSLSKLGIAMRNENKVLITIHRRENHGERLDQILKAIIFLSEKFSDHLFVIPVHPNPNVKEKIYKTLDKTKNIILTNPLSYPQIICFIKNSKLILTDSGGIQEEAPSFGVPTLVLRYETERKEGIRDGFTLLVGADFEKIIHHASLVLQNSIQNTRINSLKNPYGDGNASQRILHEINHYFNS